tara:strand:+ start:4474 stop:5490 length:1017 start_codon:yes stop_codon:yes gene_type:complete
LNKPIIEEGYFNLTNLMVFLRKHSASCLKYSLYITLIFVVYFFAKTPEYSSKVSFYTNYQKINNSSMLSPFLSDIAGLEDSGLSFSVSEFLSSERFLDEVISNKYNIDGEEKTLVEHWGKNYNKYLHLNPLNILATINRNMMFSKNLSKDDKKLAYAKQVLLNKIVFSENRKSSLNTITIDVKKYPSLAQQIIENIYLSLLTYSNEITSIKAKEKIIFISGRINQVKFDLNSSEQEMISFMEKNKNFSSSPSLLVEKDRIQRNINLYNSLYLSLSDQLELAKIDEKDNTSSVFLLDNPYENSYKTGAKFLQFSFSVFILSFFCFSFIYLIKARKDLFL